MLRQPALPLDRISAFLSEQYGLGVRALTFLPSNYANTAAYRVENSLGGAFFLKLRLDPLDVAALAVPLFLHSLGLRQIIAPLPSASGQYSATLAEYNAILYPFVAGRSGFQAPLSAAQWAEFGAALHTVHSAALPAQLTGVLPSETYGQGWRDKLRGHLSAARKQTFSDPAAAQLARVLVAQGEVVLDLIRRAERLGAALRAWSLPLVLCHADIHAGNLLLDGRGGVYIVDWDNPILAPKERDLMYIGAGIGGTWNTPEEAEQFYRGYGPGANGAAISYYRCERIVEDLEAYIQELWLGTAGAPEDRLETAQSIERWFAPGSIVDLARGAQTATLRK